MPGNWTDYLNSPIPGDLGSSGHLGSIGNDHVLLATATILALAVLLPASRDGGAVFFGTDKGKTAFRTTLIWLIVTMMATWVSTLGSFGLLMASLWVCLSMARKAIEAKAKADEDEEAATERVNAILLGRPAGKAAPADTRCRARRKSDGEQCMNTAKSGGRCGIHAVRAYEGATG